MSEVKLGQLADAAAGRDAVHVAILPMLALRRMMPGEKTKNGVVDPFLDKPVEQGQWYYLCLYPGTVTALRHVWSHPKFRDEAEEDRCQENTARSQLAAGSEINRSVDRLPVPKEGS